MRWWAERLCRTSPTQWRLLRTASAPQHEDMTKQPMRMSRVAGPAAALMILLISACLKQTPTSPTPPAEPPPPEPSTANVYILPGAVNLGANAFGDEPVVIYRGERMRWRNVDGVEHDV